MMVLQYNTLVNMITESVIRHLTDKDSRFDKKGFEFLIGIPGSGKSTYLRKIQHPNVVVICPDDIRRELTGDISDQSMNGEVWKEAENRINNELSEGKYVILDATNVNTRLRNALANRIRENNGNIDIYATMFNADPEESKKRIRNDINNNVDRANVPDHVIDNMYNMYNDSLKSVPYENYKEIYHIN